MDWHFEYGINVVDVVIALIGVLISVFQGYSFLKDKKKEREVRNTVKQVGEIANECAMLQENIRNNSHNISNSKRITEKFVSNMYAVKEKGLSESEESRAEFEIISNSYTDILNAINDIRIKDQVVDAKLYNIYKILLAKEDKFAVSYGFNRYIDAIRNYFENEYTKALEAVYEKVEEDIRIFYKSYTEENIKKELYPVTYKYLLLLICKNGDVSIFNDFPGQTEFKKGAMMMYNEYWKYLFDDKLYENAYGQIKPIMNEMIIKFQAMNEEEC